MVDVLIKAFAFIFIIIMAYTLKKIGFFKKEDYLIVSKIALSITLPAAVITSFAGFKMEYSLLFLVLFAILSNAIMLLFGYLYSKNKSDKDKAFFMMNMPGHNIGSFTMPYIQAFLGPFGVIATCMFDTGNAIMCTGFSYAITANVTKSGERASFKSLVKKLLSSVPFVTYTTMLLITLIGIDIPKPILSITTVIGNANPFIAMFMIGLMFEITFDKKHLKQIAFVLFFRYLFAGILSYVFFFLTPFSLEIRQVLSIVVFAPISALAPIFTQRCKGDGSLSSLAGSLSIVISVIIMTTLLTVMHI